MSAHYDGCITLNKTDNTVNVYRYVRYDNGQNNLLDDSTHRFDTTEEATSFAERMHDAYKAKNVRLVVKPTNILPSDVTQDSA